MKFPRKMPKLPKLPKMPKFISSNKPRNPAIKQIMVIVIVLLIAFSAFYAMKFFGLQGWTPVEGYADPQQPAYKVVLIHSESCGHCVRFVPKFDKVSADAPTLFPGKRVTFEKIKADTITASSPYVSYLSNGIPATLVEKDGTVVHTMVGNVESEDKLVQDLKTAMM